jgi:5-methylcytosine-specific restriction endonuclease McrA
MQRNGSRIEMNKTGPENDRTDQIIAEARRNRELREQTYRDQALKLYPSICARCGREFSGKKLRELTVHHKDHNHDNNPPDGSNWELLCLYCHDNEHQEYLDEKSFGKPAPGDDTGPSATFKPFADLEALLKNKKK